MAVARTIRALVTEEEFLSLPESTDRIELLDGEVIVSPSPSFRHQRILLTLVRELSAWAASHPPATVAIAPLDVRFAPSRILQPDALVVLAGIPDDAATPLDVLPDLVVEVLSGRRSYDRITKRVVYAEAGVAEYWVVDDETRSIEVHRADGTTRFDDVLRSALLPGFSLSLDGLFGAS
jgi:Uma2 family endonuclease